MSMATHAGYTAEDNETDEPAAVRAARWTSWTALAGALVQWMGFLAVLALLAFAEPPSAPGEMIILLTVAGLVVSVPSLVAWAAVRAANGRPGGRAVLWTFGPLALALSIAMAVGAVDLIVNEGHRAGPKFVLLLLVLAATALYCLPIVISAVLWTLPPARSFLAGHRHGDREALGRGLLTAAAVLLAVAIGAALITAVLMTFAPRELADTGDADHLTASLTWATIVAGVVAVIEILLLGGTILTRLTGRRLLRAVVYGAGMLMLVAQMPAIVVIGLGVGAVGDESGDDVALTYAWTGITVFSLGAILHLVAMLLVAMPSVSDLVTPTEPDDTTPLRT